MINILLALFFSGCLYIAFKIFKHFNVDTFQAIVFNYLIAFILGLLLNQSNIELHQVYEQGWFTNCVILGVLFIVVFYIIGKTTQVNGLTVASVASKMSMIIPILFGIFYFKENVTNLIVLGIVLALFAVFFVSKNENEKINFSSFKFPILLFFGAGIIDTLINYTQYTHLTKDEVSLFSAFTFLFAFIFGCFSIVYKILKKEFHFELRNFIAGIALGVPNFFSMFYLTKALQTENMDSSIIFTILNIGVILFTTFVGIIFFKEKMSKQNYFGIALAIIALFLVTN